MSKPDSDNEIVSDNVTWTSQKKDERKESERRSGEDRRQMSGRTITVPDMRQGERRSGKDRRKVRLTITGRAMNI
ncbi:hypothetical protein [Aliikangiella sp. IMCC44359]|uniref:hypothetical protein n=1 Tax=Aliikangiella sp. IMCC44359 TaxID=3459125 RepID=UPI00403B35A0